MVTELFRVYFPSKIFKELRTVIVRGAAGDSMEKDGQRPSSDVLAPTTYAVQGKCPEKKRHVSVLRQNFTVSVNESFVATKRFSMRGALPSAAVASRWEEFARSTTRNRFWIDMCRRFFSQESTISDLSPSLLKNILPSGILCEARGDFGFRQLELRKTPKFSFIRCWKRAAFVLSREVLPEISHFDIEKGRE